jgi:hypothetical protein
MGTANDQPAAVKVILTLVLGMVALITLTGVGITLYGVRQIYGGYQSRSWPTVDGVVTASGVQRMFDPASAASDDDTPDWTHTARVEYRYTVGSGEFTASRVEMNDAGTSNASRAAALAKQYPAGAKVTVYYDPGDPSRAVLQPGIARNSVLLVVVGCMFALVPTVAFGIPIWRKLRSTPSRSDTRHKSESVGESPEGLPRGSNVRVIAESSNKLELLFLPGRKGVETTGGLAAVFLGLGTFVLIFFAPDLFDERGTPETREYVVTVAGGIAFLGGLALLIWWTKLKTLTTRMTLTRESLTLEERWWARKRKRSATLTPESRATRVADHEDNGEPVFALTFEPADPSIRFAITLSDREQTWAVERMNRLLVGH